MTYPLYASALVQHHHFTQAQLTTIVLAYVIYLLFSYTSFAYSK